MFYFIPAWYQGSEWRESEQFWYRRRMQTETDDTVKQIQLFQRNAVCDYRILLLSYAPNLRHFLHRQSAFRAPYYSIFDAIQEVRRKKQAILSFHNLNWPKRIEFIYTPFSVLAMLDGERYANVEFGEYGNPIQVDLYRDGVLSRKNIYDDRGFVSCTSIYENGQKSYDQYLTDRGVWKLCHFSDGHVAVNPRSNHYLIFTGTQEISVPFRRSSYDTMEEVVGEVLESFLSTTGREDIFCAAAHELHLPLLERHLRGRKTIYSVFGERLSLQEGNRAAVRALSRAACLVADSQENLERLNALEALREVSKVNIPPYDTRSDRGISMQLAVQKILFPVDHLARATLETAIGYLAGYLERNEDARVHLFTRDAAFDREEKLLRQVGDILEKRGYPRGWARRSSDKKFEFMLDGEGQLPIKFVVEQCIDELSVNKCVREQRLLVDLADTPDLFLQISCVGMGIPQLVKSPTQYLRPGENGRVVKDLSRLGEDLAYYLESLANWNAAMIRSYELGRTHTAQHLVEEWKEVMERIGNRASLAAGK